MGRGNDECDADTIEVDVREDDAAGDEGRRRRNRNPPIDPTLTRVSDGKMGGTPRPITFEPKVRK